MRTETIKTVRSKLRKDTRFVQLKEAVQSNRVFQINTDSLLDEIQMMHKLREVRKIDPKLVRHSMLSKLMEANMQDQGYRSRLSEICLQCNRASAKLRRAIEQLQTYMLVRYYDEIRELGLRTKEERTNLIDTVLTDVFQFVEGIEEVVEAAETIIEDIDKAHYSLKLGKEIIELHTHKEWGVS